MFYIKNPSALKKPWILSKDGNILIPIEVTQFLKNYHIMAIEFLYHNYRKGMKGSILNLEPDMNLPLVLSAFFRALIKEPAIVVIICARRSISFWHYHLTNHGNLEVIQLSTKNSKDTFTVSEKGIALLVPFDCLKLCEDILDHDLFSIVVEDLDQIAVKRIMRKLEGKFSVGLTYRSFYTDPDQKIQWSMLNWANPGCVGKLNNFYEIDNNNFDRLVDNYRHWWLRLTWKFCESFSKPTSEDLETYEKIISDWASSHGLNFTQNPEKKSRKRKKEDTKPVVTDEIISDSCSSDATIVNEVPIDKYVKLPSMDENPILTSIKKNFELSPEPILPKTCDLPYTQSKADSSEFLENSVIWSFLEDDEKPSTSRSESETFTSSESEQFIINLIGSSDNQDSKSQDINDILKKADAVLQN